MSPLQFFYLRRFSPYRRVGVTLKEAQVMEASSRSQTEALSHPMWVLTALIKFMLTDSLSPSDPVFFNQILASVSRGLASQSDTSAAFTSFMTKKLGDYYLSQLSPVYFGAHKRLLCRAPANFNSFLFNESDITEMLSASTRTTVLI